MTDKKDYSAEKIKVLEGLDGVRNKFDIVALRSRIKKRGDIYILSQELEVKYSSLKHALEKARILKLFPTILKSKVNALSRLKTDRELIKFSQIYNVNKLSARQLYLKVKKWNADIQIDPFLAVSQEEHDLFIGSLLGDAYARQRVRNCCFKIAHSLKQKGYLLWKKDLLNFLDITDFGEKSKLINNHPVTMIYLSTQTHPLFNYYRNLFYKNGKKVITQKVLDQLTPGSLAIWICDDGSYSVTQSYIILCTNAFSLEEHELMKKFFNERFGLDPTIGFRDKKYYYLRFKLADSKKLIKIIKPFIPRGMKYKIGEYEDGC